MDSNLLENLMVLREVAVQELTEAHDWANQLRAIINEPFGTDRSVEADYLITNILGSFTETISMLNSGEVTDPVPAKAAGVLMNSTNREFRVSGERMKSSSALKNRAVYKTRKTAIKPMTVFSYGLDDGHSWRKYGQKDILGAKFVRQKERARESNTLAAQLVVLFSKLGAPGNHLRSPRWILPEHQLRLDDTRLHLSVAEDVYGDGEIVFDVAVAAEITNVDDGEHIND